jgi:succinate dehydrogenase/fumarate reductase cytochrome b subunit
VSARSSRRRRLAVTIAGALVISATVLLCAALPAAAAAPDGTAQLSHVIDNVRNWIVGMLVTLATLFLTVAGLRYLMAGGNPGEIERAKGTLKSAAIGYALAVLAPVLVGILRSVVGT